MEGSRLLRKDKTLVWVSDQVAKWSDQFGASEQDMRQAWRWSARMIPSLSTTFCGRRVRHFRSGPNHLRMLCDLESRGRINPGYTAVSRLKASQTPRYNPGF